MYNNNRITATKAATELNPNHAMKAEARSHDGGGASA